MSGPGINYIPSASVQVVSRELNNGRGAQGGEAGGILEEHLCSIPEADCVGPASPERVRKYQKNIIYSMCE